MGTWIWAFALSAWITGHPSTRAGCPAPIIDPPEGWLFIPGEVVDSLPGELHDAVSGAYVNFDGYARGTLGSDPPEVVDRETHQGFFQGVPYSIEVIPNVREYLAQHWKERLGMDYPDDAAEQFSFPMQGADRVRVIFRGKSTQWTLTSDIYDAAQDARFRQLLFDPAATLCLGDHGAGAHPKGTTESTYRLIHDGDSAASVMDRLGPPQLAKRSGRTGLVLSYVFERPDRWYWVHLYFDQQQRLVRRVEELAP